MIGIDIETVVRLERLLQRKPKTLSRFFSTYEWDYAQKKAKPAQTLAGIWCAKEAVVKAFSSFNEVLFVTDIEIHHYNTSVPFVFHISNQNLLTKYDIQISISHTSDYAVAMAIVMLKK